MQIVILKYINFKNISTIIYLKIEVKESIVFPVKILGALEGLT